MKYLLTITLQPYTIILYQIPIYVIFKMHYEFMKIIYRIYRLLTNGFMDLVHCW